MSVFLLKFEPMLASVCSCAVCVCDVAVVPHVHWTEMAAERGHMQQLVAETLKPATLNMH